jgi:hypothetical protein
MDGKIINKTLISKFQAKKFAKATILLHFVNSLNKYMNSDEGQKVT